jgi:hypothetical protein
VARLTREQKAAETVAHALAVQRACAAGNYTAFFRLHVSAPMMSGYIMDHMRDRERIKALVVLSRACVRVPGPVCAAPLTNARAGTCACRSRS